MKDAPMKRTDTLLFSLLMAVLVPIELVCASIAYRTLGEVASAAYFLAVGINIVFILIAVRNRTIGALCAFALALAIVPYQVLLSDRLLRVQDEAARIVTYLYEHQKTKGVYPKSLANYTYEDPPMRPYIQAYVVDDDLGDFELIYRVGTKATGHWYNPKHGWGYYPD